MKKLPENQPTEPVRSNHVTFHQPLFLGVWKGGHTELPKTLVRLACSPNMKGDQKLQKRSDSSQLANEMRSDHERTPPRMCLNSGSSTVQSDEIEYVWYANPSNETTTTASYSALPQNP